MNNVLPAARFEPHRAHLLSLARGWLGSHADAQDAVQDTWVRAQSGVPPGLASDVAWLVTVLRHLCVDRLRRRQLAARTVLADIDHDQSAPSAEQAAALSMTSQGALRHLAAVLPAGDLAALLLHAVFEFEHAEIARLAGQSEAAMRQRVHRALRRARSRFADEASSRAEHAKRPVRPARPAAGGPDDLGAEVADQDAQDAQDTMFSLCWRALSLRDAAGLIAQFAREQAAPPGSEASPVLAAPAVATGATKRTERNAAHPRSTSRILQIDGAFALAWILDGVVLCTVPMQPRLAIDEAQAVA